LHSDHLGSTVLETNTSGNPTANQQYCAYGRKRTLSNGTTVCGSGNSLATDHTFTDQKLDGTGLQYFNARYYDPAMGTFISPDTIVPDATNVFDYNRYMYGLGNPISHT
jgi:RHS repeat-associated protein